MLWGCPHRQPRRRRGALHHGRLGLHLTATRGVQGHHAGWQSITAARSVTPTGAGAACLAFFAPPFLPAAGLPPP